MSNKSSGVTDIKNIDGRMEIHGFPTARRIGKLDTKPAKRLADLRMHQSTLQFCQRALNDFVGATPRSPDLGRAAMVGIVATYFSCFGDNKASMTLQPGRVFKGELEGRKVFDYWLDIRRKHLIHNESQYQATVIGAVLGDGAELQTILSLNMTPGLAVEEGNWKSLSQLVGHTLHFVEVEAESASNRVFEETNKMSAAERLALPEAKYTAPTTDMASKRRP